MMYRRIPLARVLKGKMLRIAELQDSVILELSKRVDFVVHGGTAIWRVFGGKRFSFDVYVYCDDVESIPRALSSNLKVVRVKMTPSRVLYARVQGLGVEVEVEASPMFTRRESMEADLWLVDGTSLVVKVLTPCSLLEEKIKAFLDRRKSRDLYDIYYLIDLCQETKRVREGIFDLLEALRSPPEDYEVLKELILMGVPPSFGTIVGKVRSYAEEVR